MINDINDKGNSVLFINEIIQANVEKLLANLKQFTTLSTDQNKEIIFILHCEQKVIEILKEIKNKNQINEDLQNKLRPVGNQPGVHYGLAKIHKKDIDSFPAFRPIVSAIGAPRYEVIKLFFLYLKI